MLLAAPASVLFVASGYVIFEHESLSSGWWMMRRLKWWGLGAAIGGAVVGYYSGLLHQHWIAHQQLELGGSGKSKKPGPMLILLAFPRLVIHVPFYGVLIVFACLWALLAGLLRWLASKLRLVKLDDRARSVGVVTPGLSPLWFLVGPLLTPQYAAEEDLDLPSLEAQARNMIRWVVWFPIVLANGTQAYNSETGEPIDPRWLVVLGTYWIGDYVAQWWVMRARVLGQAL